MGHVMSCDVTMSDVIHRTIYCSSGLNHTLQDGVTPPLLGNSSLNPGSFHYTYPVMNCIYKEDVVHVHIVGQADTSL